MARHGVHAYNPSTREVEVGRLGVQDQLQLRRLSYFSPILLNSLILLSFLFSLHLFCVESQTQSLKNVVHYLVDALCPFKCF